jgi:hypothetical protein
MIGSNTALKSNHDTFEDTMAKATQLGIEAGRGADTQIRFDLLVAEGAYHHTLDLTPNKHGLGRRDGVVLAEAYVTARRGAVKFDAKSDKSRKLVSNIDKMIRLGSMTMLGRGEPMASINAFKEHWEKLRADPATAKRLDDAHNAMMRFATAQLKSKTLLPEDERNAFVFKTESEAKDLTETVNAMRNDVMRLMAGKLKRCPHDKDDGPEARATLDSFNKWMTAIAKRPKP